MHCIIQFICCIASALRLFTSCGISYVRMVCRYHRNRIENWRARKSMHRIGHVWGKILDLFDFLFGLKTINSHRNSLWMIGRRFRGIQHRWQALQCVRVDVSIEWARYQALQRDSLALHVHLLLLHEIFLQKGKLRQALCRWTSWWKPASYYGCIANGEIHFGTYF